jgi:hypothetical protein
MGELERRILTQINEANEVMRRQGNEVTLSITEKERGLNDTI